jgi:2-deoxy-D-gluconate 3-dehydrogenase
VHGLFDLHGQIALVTGGASGIGEAIALALAEAGADVAITSHKSPSINLQSRVEALDRRFLDVQTDLSRADAAEDLLGAIEQGLGPVGILVNNAGIIRRAPAVEYSDLDWEDVLDVNLTALWRLSRAAGRRMLARRRGKIINIASVLSFQGGILVPAYAAAKHGVAGLTRSLANEWASHGVNVNAIAPGYIATDNTAPLRADEQRSRQVLERIPAGRWGEPGDLGGAAIFLASAAADYVHGVILAVDGGWLAR